MRGHSRLSRLSTSFASDPGRNAYPIDPRGTPSTTRYGPGVSPASRLLSRLPSRNPCRRVRDGRGTINPSGWRSEAALVSSPRGTIPGQVLVQVWHHPPAKAPASAPRASPGPKRCAVSITASPGPSSVCSKRGSMTGSASPLDKTSSLRGAQRPTPPASFRRDSRTAFVALGRGWQGGREHRSERPRTVVSEERSGQRRQRRSGATAGLRSSRWGEAGKAAASTAASDLGRS